MTVAVVVHLSRPRNFDDFVDSPLIYFLPKRHIQPRRQMLRQRPEREAERCGFRMKPPGRAASCLVYFPFRSPYACPFLPLTRTGRDLKVVNTGDGRPGGGGLTVSVNTNWFNGFNLERVYAFLRSELDAVRLELDHLRDSWSDSERNGEGEGEGRGWERQCELVMRANSALSLTEFARMVMARAQLLLGNEVADANADAAATADDGKSRSARGVDQDHVAETSRRISGGSGRRNGEWQEERWTVLALDQVLAVLRELSASPCIDHIFLAEDYHDGCDQGGGARSQSSSIDAREDSGAERHSKKVEGGADKACSLRETLEAVEAYLRDRRHSKSSRLQPSSKA